MMTSNQALVDSDLVRRVVGEYREMPGLSVTLPQASRLWGLPPDTCRALVDILIEKGFVRRTCDGKIVRAE